MRAEVKLHNGLDILYLIPGSDEDERDIKSIGLPQADGEKVLALPVKKVVKLLKKEIGS